MVLSALRRDLRGIGGRGALLGLLRRIIRLNSALCIGILRACVLRVCIRVCMVLGRILLGRIWDEASIWIRAAIGIKDIGNIAGQTRDFAADNIVTVSYTHLTLPTKA